MFRVLMYGAHRAVIFATAHAAFTPHLFDVVTRRHIEVLVLVFVGSVSHSDQHQDHAVSDRVV